MSSVVAWCVQLRTDQIVTVYTDDVDLLIDYEPQGTEYRFTHTSSIYLERFLALSRDKSPISGYCDFGWRVRDHEKHQR